jgi:uncharacterized protein YqjF (DUF2071 family)
MLPAPFASTKLAVAVRGRKDRLGFPYAPADAKIQMALMNFSAACTRRRQEEPARSSLCA